VQICFLSLFRNVSENYVREIAATNSLLYDGQVPFLLVCCVAHRGLEQVKANFTSRFALGMLNASSETYPHNPFKVLNKDRMSKI
jgi:hypothetical protein